MFTLKSTDEITVSWSIVVIPILLALVIFAAMLTTILMNIVRGKYHLSVVQWLSLIGYSATWCLCCIAVYQQITNYGNNNNSEVPGSVPILWTGAVVLFTLSGLWMLNTEGWRLSVSRGYDEPTPLELGVEGWTATTAAAQRGAATGWEDTLLLGRVSLARGGIRSYRQLLEKQQTTTTTTVRVSMNTVSGGSSGGVVIRSSSEGVGVAVDVMRSKLNVMEPLGSEDDVYLRDSYQKGPGGGEVGMLSELEQQKDDNAV